MDQDTIDSINRRLDMLEENIDRFLQRYESFVSQSCAMQNHQAEHIATLYVNDKALDGKTKTMRDELKGLCDIVKENEDDIRKVQEATRDVPRLVSNYKAKHDHYCKYCKKTVYTDMGGRYPQFNWCDYQNCCKECAIEID